MNQNENNVVTEEETIDNINNLLFSDISDIKMLLEEDTKGFISANYDMISLFIESFIENKGNEEKFKSEIDSLIKTIKTIEDIHTQEILEPMDFDEDYDAILALFVNKLVRLDLTFNTENIKNTIEKMTNNKLIIENFDELSEIANSLGVLLTPSLKTVEKLNYIINNEVTDVEKFRKMFGGLFDIVDNYKELLENTKTKIDFNEKEGSKNV